MKKPIGAALLIGSTLIWASVIVGSAVLLKGSEYKEMISRILYYGVIVHVMLLNVSLLWTKNKKYGRAGIVIILSALIWGGMMIWTSITLKGTEFKDKVARGIQGGASAHLLFIWAPMGILDAKLKAQSLKEEKKIPEYKEV